MPTLIFLLILAVVFTAIGVLCWLVLYIFRYRQHGKKTAKITLFAYLISLPAILFLVLPLLFSTLIANAGTRPQDLALTTTPTEYGREYQEIEFSSRDGVQLSGWLMPGTVDHPAIVFSHGLFRSRQEVLERSCRLNELGYAVLIFDFRSHGKSDGRRVTLGFLERLDVLGAADYLQTHPAKIEGLVLGGVSMGAVATTLATKDAGLQPLALIADSPFVSLEKTVARHTWLYLRLPGFPFTQIFAWNLGRLGGFALSGLNTQKALSAIESVPTLLLYGTEDDRMPRSVAEELYESAASNPKELVFFEGAGHGHAFDTDPDRYVETIDAFLSSVESE